MFGVRQELVTNVVHHNFQIGKIEGIKTIISHYETFVKRYAGEILVSSEGLNYPLF